MFLPDGINFGWILKQVSVAMTVAEKNKSLVESNDKENFVLQVIMGLLPAGVSHLEEETVKQLCKMAIHSIIAITKGDVSIADINTKQVEDCCCFLWNNLCSKPATLPDLK